MSDLCVSFAALWGRHYGFWTVAPPGQSELHRCSQ